MAERGGIVVVAGGTWHAPHLAHQLHTRGMLNCAVTTTPPGRFVSRGTLPKRRARWLAGPALRGGAIGQAVPALARFAVGDLRFAEAVDLAARRIVRRRHPDAVVVFARFGLFTIRDQHRHSRAVSVLERGSVHVSEQETAMRSEYRELGLTFPEPDGRLLERELEEYEEVDYISVPSLSAEESFVRRGVEAARIIRIPYGVDLARFHPRPGVGRPDGRIRILAVGNLGIGKGTHHLLRALRSLKDPSWVLVMVGALDGYVRDEIRRLHLGAQVEVVGRVRQAELVHYYRSADLFVHPSLHEGMSMAVLEALACGLPVVVSDRSGYTGILVNRQNGMVVPAGDVVSLAAAIGELRQDADLRRSLGDSARLTAQRHSWEAYGDRIAAALVAITRQHRATPRVNP